MTGDLAVSGISSTKSLLTPDNAKCCLLYVVGQLGAGGLERQLYLLLQNMDRDRYRPHVFVWNFDPNDTYVSEIEKLGVPLHAVPAIRTSVGKIFAFRRLVQKMKPEVV